MEGDRLSRDIDNEVELERIEDLLISRTHSFSCLLEIILREEGFDGRVLLEVKVVFSEAANAGDHLDVSFTDGFRSTSHDEMEASVYSSR